MKNEVGLAELLVTFEVFKDQVAIWLNQGSSQVKIILSRQEGLELAEWLLQDDDEAWPCVGLPLPGSNQQDCFKPEEKPVAEAAYGFRSKNIKAFKCLDIEYSARSLELEIGAAQFIFLHDSLAAWLKGAQEVIHYKHVN
jgi:hypothetical protein